MVDTKILAYWHDKPLRAHEAFAQIGDFLRQVQARHPAFSNFHIANPKGYRPIEADLSNLIPELVGVLIPDRTYRNDDPDDDSFSMNSFCRYGFGATFTNAKRSRDQTVDLNVYCGSLARLPPFDDSPNRVVLTISPEIETPELLRNVFELTAQFWRPQRGMITRPEIRDLLDQPAGEVKPGWLTYIANPEVASALPADITHRPYLDGVVIQAAEQPGRSDDAEYVRKVLRIRNLLRSKGLLTERKPVAPPQ